jgi:hypothetical protein
MPQNHDLGLSVGRVLPTSVELTWTPDPGQEWYRIVRDDREIGSCSGQCFIDEEACPDTEYAYRVLSNDQAAGDAVVKVRTGPWPTDAGDTPVRRSPVSRWSSLCAGAPLLGRRRRASPCGPSRAAATTPPASTGPPVRK